MHRIILEMGKMLLHFPNTPKMLGHLSISLTDAFYSCSSYPMTRSVSMHVKIRLNTRRFNKIFNNLNV